MSNQIKFTEQELIELKELQSEYQTEEPWIELI